MSNNPEQPNIQHEVLERIRSGQLLMRSPLFFVSQVVLLLALAGLILFLSALLASFIFFDIRLNGHASLLGFGPRGALLFLSVFPWSLALIDIALIALLGWLLRRFKFAYRRALFYIFLGLLAVAGIMGFVFDEETGFHDDRFEEAEQGELFFPFESLYEAVNTRAPEEWGLYRGFVIRIREDLFIITYDDQDDDEDDHTWNVIPPSDFDLHDLRIGDRVYVAGDQDDEVIRAFGIRILER